VENIEHDVVAAVDHGVLEGVEGVENVHNTETKTKVKIKRGPQVPVKEFLKVWQSSESVQEVADTLNMKPQSVYIRALGYKKKGINLKNMSKGSVGGKKLDTDELNRFLEELS
jgi:hypothetical protein